MNDLTDKEKEWVETASKYINSKHLPWLGRCLKIKKAKKK